MPSVAVVLPLVPLESFGSLKLADVVSTKGIRVRPDNSDQGMKSEG